MEPCGTPVVIVSVWHKTVNAGHLGSVFKVEAKSIKLIPENPNVLICLEFRTTFQQSCSSQTYSPSV